jgi:D-lactate dehydrogenase (cytochrome)
MITKTDADAIAPYLTDASNMAGGAADAVYLPESPDQIARLLADCSSTRTAVTVSGAGTGLSGARVPFGGVVLSTERLNRILQIDPDGQAACVQPGAILGEFQFEVERLELLYPPDPTERTCSIGGTLATNASGARTFKYGSTRDYVAAIDVVLADGDLLSLRRGDVKAEGATMQLRTEGGRGVCVPVPTYRMPPVKHAAGYFARAGMDAVDLFIGSEGTLGVIVEAELRLISLPGRLFSGVVFFSTERATLGFVEAARDLSHATRLSQSDGIEARALEFIDELSLDLIREKYPSIPNAAHGGCVWFEQEITGENEERLLGGWLALMQQFDACVDDSWFAVGLEDQRRLREFRHAVPAAVNEFVTSHGSVKIGSDMAVPDGRLRELLTYYRAELRGTELRNATWGHIGNNHLHTNILARDADEVRLGRELYVRFVRKALELGGTVSAEHGIGKLKRPYLAAMFGSEGIAQMRAVKHALDPYGILGSGTMFDSQ